MQVCFNITCNKKVHGLYPDQNGNPGRVCQACFVPPEIDRADELVVIRTPKTLKCNHKPCNKTFTQTYLRQATCSTECTRKIKNLRSKAFRLRQKERTATNG